MRKFIFSLLSILICTAWFGISVSAEDYDGVEFDENSVIVVTRPRQVNFISTFSFDETFSEPFGGLEIESIENLNPTPRNNISLFSVGGVSEREMLLLTLENKGRDSVIDAVELLNSLPEVEYAEPNYKFELMDADYPNDAYYPQQYDMGKINAPSLWEMDVDCSNMVVAVIDTGSYITHPDLQNDIWTNPNEIPGNGIDDDGNGVADDIHGIDFNPENGDEYDLDPTDLMGHGTHVSGLIAAEANNKIGIASVSRNVNLLPVKIYDSSNTYSAYVIRAINYVGKTGVRVVNNSYGSSIGAMPISVLETIQQYPNTLFICSAGNLGTDTDITNNKLYPAGWTETEDNIISVGATDSDDNISVFNNKQTPGSCYGVNTVDISAPGSRIWSTEKPSGYGTRSGTSMSAPIVSSTVAVMLSLHPDMTPKQVKEQLRASVDVVSSLKGKNATSGRLNAYKAMFVQDDSKIELYPNELFYNTGKQRRLYAITSPSEDVTWKSDNESVATVASDGTVTTVGEGIAHITASYGGISGECIVTVDDTPPTASVSYSPDAATNQNVTATISASEPLTEDSETEYIFTDNDEHTFVITDLAGNKAEIEAKVDWIDRTPPTATVNYSTVSPTNQNVIATLTDISKEINETELSHTFTDNDEYTFTITDKAGNTADIKAKVDWIDRTPPTATVSYSTVSPTNQNVIATLTDISKEINETELSHTFTDNDEYTFTITDKAGNTADIKAKVDWIDRTPPTATVSYSTVSPTNQNVIATLTDISKEINETELSHTFTDNDEYTFTITDKADNTADIKAKVDWIDKTPPTAEIEYTPDTDTYGSVTARLIPSEAIREGELSYEFSDNGSHTFTFTDMAGNTAEKIAEVWWIIHNLPPIPTDRVELEYNDITDDDSGIDVKAELIFEVTVPPARENIRLYAAYKEKGVLKKVELIEDIKEDLTAYFTIPNELKNSDISIYVWDKDMKPLMPVQEVN